MCAKNCRSVRKVTTTRRENVPKGDKRRCKFLAREFRHDDPEMERLHTSGSTVATSGLVDMHAVQHGNSILCLDAENAYFHAEEDEEVHCWPPKEWVKRYHARGGRVENPWWKLKRQLYGTREAAKMFNETGTSSEVLPSRCCSPRGQQGARIARRSRPPKIATTWQVSLGDTEAWNRDTKVQ